MRLASTTLGPGVVSEDSKDDVVRIVDAPLPDLGGLLRAGFRVDDIARLPVRGEYQLSKVLLAPVVRPESLWAQGGGYFGHLATGAPRPAHPKFFLIAPSSVIGSGEPVVLPTDAAEQVDYEGEVAVVVGRPMRNVAERDVWDHLAGVTLLNDISARDIQRGRHPAARGIENPAIAKSFDTFSPIGPVLTTVDEFADPDDIDLTTDVDGGLRQHGTTADLIFSVPELLSFLTARVSLRPGDIVTTGSPVGIGETTGDYLAVGATVTVRSPLIGALSNPVIAGAKWASE